MDWVNTFPKDMLDLDNGKQKITSVDQVVNIPRFLLVEGVKLEHIGHNWHTLKYSTSIGKLLEKGITFDIFKRDILNDYNSNGLEYFIK